MENFSGESEYSFRIRSGVAKEMRFTLFFEVLGWVSILTSGFVGIIGFYKSEAWGGVMVLALGVVIGTLLVSLRRNYKILYDGEKIRYSDILRRWKVVYWNNVREVRVKLSGELSLGDGKNKIEISYYLSGVPEFLEMAKEKLPASMSEVIKKFERILETNTPQP